MKPALCALCGQSPELPGGAWVEFADYDDGAIAALDFHPQGLEFFCSQHLPLARACAGLDSQHALAQLAGQPPQQLQQPRPAARALSLGQRLRRWLD